MGNTNIVVLLLQHSADPNAQTMHNETSLHLASRAGRIEAVKLLLRNGAMIDAKARVSLFAFFRVSCLHTIIMESSAN